MSDRTGSVDPFREIELPDGTDPIEKGIIRSVRKQDGTVSVTVAIGGLGDDLAERVVEQIRGAALTLEGVDHARIEPVQHEDEDVEIPEIEHVLAVASAKGGVGKTTVSVALARQLQASGLDVGLFDADIYGPNVPHVLDVEGPILANEDGQPVPLDADGIQLLSPGLAGGDPPTARRGAIAYGAIQNLLVQGAWDPCDILLVDMPAGNDDVVGAALEHVPLDGAILVTTPFDASVDDTKRTIDLFVEHDVEPVAAVVNMSSFTCSCCGEQNTLFDDPVDVDVPSVVQLPFDRDLQRDPGREGGHDALEDTADAVIEFVSDLEDTIPDDAFDLRGLPPASQARQLTDDLAAVDSGETVTAVVEDPTWDEESLQAVTGDLMADVSRSPLGADGTVLELTRA